MKILDGSLAIWLVRILVNDGSLIDEIELGEVSLTFISTRQKQISDQLAPRRDGSGLLRLRLTLLDQCLAIDVLQGDGA